MLAAAHLLAIVWLGCGIAAYRSPLLDRVDAPRSWRVFYAIAWPYWLVCLWRIRQASLRNERER